MYLNQKSTALIGLSVEGFASLNFFLKKGIKVTVFDKREKNNLPKDVLKVIESNKVLGYFGKNYLDNLENFDIIIRTPGMPLWDRKLIQEQKRVVKITSQTKIFFEECPCPIIGITGTKGKGTTSTLIYQILKIAGFDAYLGGNIGVPSISFLDKLNLKSIAVLELSSFQLEDATLSPHIAVVLNITSEHLGSQSPDSPNYHKHHSDYLKAKENIIRYQKKSDFSILNYDSNNTKNLDKRTKASVLYFSNRTEVPIGAYVKKDKIILKTPYSNEYICSVQDVGLIGKHNLENVTAAICASSIMGVSPDVMKSVIKDFKGLEHRLEFVREFKGISFYNDSFSTVPETAIAAIQSFDNPIILIVGGSEKNSDYTLLGEEIINKKVKAVILIGQTAKRIEESIKKSAQSKKKMPKIVRNLKKMDKIVSQALSLAKRGDVVLLSPASASFGLFENYKQRGLLFKKYVYKLKS